MSVDLEAQRDEMLALKSIFDNSEFTSEEIDSELSGKFYAYVTLPEGFKIIYRMLPPMHWRNVKKHRESEPLGPFEEVILKYLPPLELSFTLPSDYPSTSPPRFTLTSCWLDRKQLSTLCSKLDALWHEKEGSEILYVWLSFLKEESYNFLGLGPAFNLSKQFTKNVVCMKSFKRMQRDQARTNSNTSIPGRAGTSGVSADTKQVDSSLPQPTKEEMGMAQSRPETVKKPEARPRGRGRGQWRDNKKNEFLNTRPGTVPLIKQDQLSSSSKKVTEQIKQDWNAQDSSLSHRHSSSSTIVNEVSKNNRQRHFKRREAHQKGFFALDQRAVFSVPSDVSLIDLLKEHNSLMKNKEFERNIFTCRVCFDDKSGGQCLEFYECGHVFCRDCAKGYFEVRIKEGNVQFMTCLEEGCKTEALQKQVQETVGPDLFAKYDALLLSSTLDLMEDIVYCPRKDCQYPVTRDGDDKMGICPHCQYSFCILCKMGYHGVEPCRMKAVVKKELVTEYENASADKKGLLEAKYGRKQLLQLVDASRSEEWISTYSKNCPHCQAAIEKSDGCNRMLCWRCNTNFCWICSARLDPKHPYLHFNSQTSPCFNMLFFGAFEEEEEDDDFANDFFDFDEER